MKGLVEKFEADRARYPQFLADYKAGKVPDQFEVQYDFRSLAFFRHEADELRNLLINETSSDPKVTMAGVQLRQSLHSLEKCVDQRAEEMQRLIQLRGKVAEDEYAHAYFGLETDAGHLDERYADAMHAVRDLLDSAIFFSVFIAKRLSERGTRLSRSFGKSPEKAITWELKDSEESSLVPDPGEFPDWT